MKVLIVTLIFNIFFSNAYANRLVVTDEDDSYSGAGLITRSVELDNLDGASNYLYVNFCEQNNRTNQKDCETVGEFSSLDWQRIQDQDLNGFFNNACPLLFAETTGYIRKCLKSFQELNIFEVRGERTFRVVTDNIGYLAFKTAIEHILSRSSGI